MVEVLGLGAPGVRPALRLSFWPLRKAWRKVTELDFVKAIRLLERPGRHMSCPRLQGRSLRVTTVSPWSSFACQAGSRLTALSPGSCHLAVES